MSSLKVLTVVAIAVAFLPTVTMAVVYTVGDDSGWDTGIDYTAWTKGKEFRIGDALEFLYAEGVHNVVEVNGRDFQACSVPANAPTWSSGDDKIVLEKAGRRWLICGIPGHCEAGMTLAITVV